MEASNVRNACLCSCSARALIGTICLTYLNVFLELDIEAKMYMVYPYNFPIGFPLVLSAAQLACSFPLRKCWLLQAIQDEEFLSLPLRCLCCFWFCCGPSVPPSPSPPPPQVSHQFNSSGDCSASAVGTDMAWVLIEPSLKSVSPSFHLQLDLETAIARLLA